METINKNIKIGCVTPLSVIVFLAFFFAKIFDKIDWSWWWVFSPLWIPLAIVLSVLILGGIIWVLLILFDKKVW
jgi:hypothetical protein